MMLICQKNFQKKLDIMQEFLKIHNWRVTISAWEEFKSNSKAVNRRVAVLYSGECICIKEIILYKSVAMSKRKSFEVNEESGTKIRF